MILDILKMDLDMLRLTHNLMKLPKWSVILVLHLGKSVLHFLDLVKSRSMVKKWTLKLAKLILNFTIILVIFGKWRGGWV